MSLTLRLWKDGDRANATEHPFEQGVVGIGRDPTNLLQLARPNVSKNHACIEQREGGLCITDLKSRNGTYVNGARIAPKDPHPLNVGDKVRVCDFVVEVLAWDQPTPPPSVPPGIPAVPEIPLAEEVPSAKEEPVSPEREEVIPQPVTADSTIAEENAGRLAAIEQECERLKMEVAELKQKLAAVPVTPPPVQRIQESTALFRLNAVLEAILQPVLKIMRGRILFRSEFTGATMFQDPEMAALSKRSPQEWIEFFLDAELSEQRARDRLEILAFETAEMIPHVIGLLDGYRKSVDIGTKNMLQQLNPVRIREELFKKPVQVGPLSISHRFLPFVADRIAWKAIERCHRELQEEDRGVLEQRFFRPGFIQGYISCITSAKHEQLPLRPKTSTSAKAEP